MKITHLSGVRKLCKNAKKMLKNKITIGVFLMIIAVSCGLFYWYVIRGLPNPKGLKNYSVIPISTQILDRNEKLLYEIYRDQNRTPVSLTSLPSYVKEATIAIEDADFYKHGGISFFGGIVRALKDTVILKKGLQGGSTLTQQLVKSTFLTPERTVQRKLKEIVLAIWTEQMFSKNEILELYLNQVPFGGVSYGIQEASRTFFAKDAKDLELHEASLLAGLPRAPTAYSPITNYERAKKRQLDVLKRMRDLGYITEKERIDSATKTLDIVLPRNSISAPHFVFYVKSLLEKEYGVNLVEEGGLRVVTTLDSEIQASAEASIIDELANIESLNVTNGAVLVTRPPTGEILSMVGSVNFFSTPSGSFNVTTAHRQPGSAIKPINYAIGIERGIVSPATIFLDIPTCFNAPGQPKSYCPVNYDGQFHGLTQLRFALGNSYNIPAVKMLALNTVETFVASSESFLISSYKNPKKYGLSLTLGGGELTMIEMSQAFSAFANEGVPRKLSSILRVEDKNGTVLYEFKDPNYVKDISKTMEHPDFLKIKGERAVSRETAFLISHILLDNNARSSAFGAWSSLVIPGKAVSVKTGTTDNLRDNWTIGYTPNFLTVVWVGNNDNTPMSRVASGITGASPIWNKIMRRVLENQDDLWPRKTDDISGSSLCHEPAVNKEEPVVGQEECHARFEYYITSAGTKIGINTFRDHVPINRDTGVMTRSDDPSAEIQVKTIVVDQFGSKYCLDCVHEGDYHQTINIYEKEDSSSPDPGSSGD